MGWNQRQWRISKQPNRVGRKHWAGRCLWRRSTFWSLTNRNSCLLLRFDFCFGVLVKFQIEHFLWSQRPAQHFFPRLLRFPNWRYPLKAAWHRWRSTPLHHSLASARVSRSLMPSVSHAPVGRSAMTPNPWRSPSPLRCPILHWHPVRRSTLR